MEKDTALKLPTQVTDDLPKTDFLYDQEPGMADIQRIEKVYAYDKKRPLKFN